MASKAVLVLDAGCGPLGAHETFLTLVPSGSDADHSCFHVRNLFDELSWASLGFEMRCSTDFDAVSEHGFR